MITPFFFIIQPFVNIFTKTQVYILRPYHFTHFHRQCILEKIIYGRKDLQVNNEVCYEKILNFAVHTGELMLKSGAETYRVEDTITRILESHHFHAVDTFVIPTGIMVTIEEESFSLSTKVVRVKNRSTRLDRIEKLNQLSRDYVSGHITLDEAYKLLDEIKNCASYKPSTIILWIGISCSFFAVMFNGNWLEFILSFFIGLAVGLLQYRLSQKQIVNFFILFICSLFLGFAVMLCRYIFGSQLHIDPIVIGCIMPLLPGVAFTTAVRDAIGDELLSGICRGVEALLMAIALAAGIGISLSLSYYLGGLL